MVIGKARGGACKETYLLSEDKEKRILFSFSLFFTEKYILIYNVYRHATESTVLML